MCLAVLALDAHPRYAVVLAANRDEFHARVARAAGWWDDADAPLLAGRDCVAGGGHLRLLAGRDCVAGGGHLRLLAGRDCVAGGTWLGIDRRGRYAFVTNVREPGRHDPSAPSRGALVPRVLRDPADVEAAVVAAIGESARYNGFNLLAGEGLRATWGSNRVDAPRALSRGVHGVSNAELDTPWPKLVRTSRGVTAWAARGDDDPERLFELLADRTPASPAEMPHTGVTAEWERLLSSPFIVAPHYGTRCSTIVLIGRDGSVRFRERSFDASGTPSGEVDHRFAVATPVGAAAAH